MAGGDITQVSWEDIKEICQDYSRVASKEERSYQSSTNGVPRMKITGLLTNFKQDVTNNLATQLSTFQAKDKHKEVEATLVEYCPHYKQNKDCRCKMVTNIDNKIPPKLKPIQIKEDQGHLDAQRKPWVSKQGMLLAPLSFSGLNQAVSSMQPLSQPQQPMINAHKLTQQLAQPTPDLNKTPQPQSIYFIDSNQLPTCVVSVSNIKFCSRTTMSIISTPNIMELPMEEELEPLNDPI